MTNWTRPRLSPRAFVRRHWIDRVENYVIHDAMTGAVHVLPPAAWRIMRCIDGTRDVEQIAAASVIGDEAPPTVEAFMVVEKLAAIGLIEEGEGQAPIPSPPTYTESFRPLGRPALEQLRGFALQCDGRGECCVFFSSVGLTSDDVRRARPHVRSLPILGLPGEEPWTPLMGATTSGAAAMTLVDGHCIELEADRRCGLQARGGIDAKPMGCRAYPYAFVDDGEVIRVSVCGGCSCVFRSLNHASLTAETTPLADTSVVKSHHVGEIPLEIAITPRVSVERRKIVAWSRLLQEAVSIPDPIGMLLERSNELRSVAHEIDPHPDNAPIHPRRMLEEQLALFARSTAALSSRSNKWRSQEDHARKLYARVARASAAAAEPSRLDALGKHTALVRDESFYVRATIFGHLVAAPMATGLARMAALLVIARALDEEQDLPTEWSHPIAMAELTRRSLGQ